MQKTCKDKDLPTPIIAEFQKILNMAEGKRVPCFPLFFYRIYFFSTQIFFSYFQLFYFISTKIIKSFPFLLFPTLVWSISWPNRSVSKRQNDLLFMNEPKPRLLLFPQGIVFLQILDERRITVTSKKIIATCERCICVGGAGGTGDILFMYYSYLLFQFFVIFPICRAFL